MSGSAPPSVEVSARQTGFEQRRGGGNVRDLIRILLEDDCLLAVNKPAGLPTIPGRQGGDSLHARLVARTAGGAAPLLVHRLDRETSGVLLFARTPEAQRELSSQIRNQGMVKEYLALVRGSPADESGLIDVPLAPRASNPARMCAVRQGGKASRTRWEVLERFRGITLLRCFPLTGRQHQIRVHLAHVGLPLLVDALYGGLDAFRLSEIKPGYRPGRGQVERPLIARLTLHAAALSFTHPRTGERRTVSAPLPKDFQATLSQLRKLCGTRSGYPRGG